jgi:RimJ/RimL family protein N-acetyltransferase
VVVVELRDSCVVVGPPPVTAHLDGLDKSELLDVSSIAARLEPFQPRPIGTASLSYRDARPVKRVSAMTEPADRAMVEKLQGSVSTDEWEESGLSAMPRRWAALTPDGRLAALAGYERWGADIAQMGVAADPAERGRGYAAAAAAAAMTSALHDGLVVQWRCRVGNAASERLATCLGFAPMGRQTAVALG